MNLSFHRFPTSLLVCAALFSAVPAQASGPTREQVEFFEKQVRPLLVEHCYSCHSQAKGSLGGDLALDSRAALLEGGGSGPAVIPGNPEKSPLIKAIGYAGKLKMPKKYKLKDQEIAVLTAWVKDGAPWPAEATATIDGPKLRPPGKITDEDRRYWAIQPLREGPAPTLANDTWSANDIDRFILQKLQDKKLKPAPMASRSALVRRLTFDLHGLPPTPEEIHAAESDPSKDWYEKLVDRLLASPRYGERWGRHWLDLARYAESDGYRADEYRPLAWRYRDYVIRSFNDDKPYDRFVREQLAGDEIDPDNPEALVATGFLRHGLYEFNQRDARGQWDTILNDITDTTGEVFLGLGMGCARCHDHKFDPILQKDYYRLRAFFAGITLHDNLPVATAQQVREHNEKLAAWQEKTADIRKELDAFLKAERDKAERGAIAKFPADIQAMMKKAPSQRTPQEQQLADLAYRQVTFEFDRLEAKYKGEAKEKLEALKKRLAEFDADKPEPLPLALTVRDVGRQAAPTVVALKREGKTTIEPGFLTLLDEKPTAVQSMPTSTGRRTALADWLTRPDHPLATRVVANRIWQYHFGRGLVATSSDFGNLGDKPTHPELLDWLARRFVQDGSSFKKMHRLILTSATYRQSATPSPEAQKEDPRNLLWARFDVRRLEAEQVRDSILSVTGELNLEAGGPGVEIARPRRSIYTKTMRNNRDPLLAVFDSPEGFHSTAQRHVTTTPTQALLMINSPFMVARGRALADRIAKEKTSDDDRIERAFQLCFGRATTVKEREGALAFLREQEQKVGSKGNRRQQALADFCHVLLNANEFLYVD